MLMAQVEVIGRYMPGWSLRDIKEMEVRVRTYWADTALYRLKGNRRG